MVMKEEKVHVFRNPGDEKYVFHDKEWR